LIGDVNELEEFSDKRGLNCTTTSLRGLPLFLTYIDAFSFPIQGRIFTGEKKIGLHVGQHYIQMLISLIDRSRVQIIAMSFSVHPLMLYMLKGLPFYINLIGIHMIRSKILYIEIGIHATLFLLCLD